MRRISLSIEIALLGLLGEPKHGYAVHQALLEPAGLGLVWQIKRSQLYALLGKLEDAGYISAETEPQANKPPRKIYSLTGEGRRVFLAWIQSPVSHGRSLRLDFLVKLYFARLEGAETAARLLAAQREQCLEWLAGEKEIVAGETAGERRYSRLVHLFRMGQIEAMLTWLDHCEEA